MFAADFIKLMTNCFQNLLRLKRKYDICILLASLVVLHNSISKQEGNAYPELKPDFYIFLLIFLHKKMFPYHLKVTV